MTNLLFAAMRGYSLNQFGVKFVCLVIRGLKSDSLIDCGMQDFDFVSSNGTVLHTVHIAQKWASRDMRRRRLL